MLHDNITMHGVVVRERCEQACGSETSRRSTRVLCMICRERYRAPDVCASAMECACT